MKKVSGQFILVLHSHLPYVVNHGKWPHGMEWLFEAASETYIPILNALHDLLDEGITPKMSISLTPVLAEQLASEDFKNEFVKFLYDEIERAEKDIELFEENPKEKDFIPLAQFWIDHYRGILQDFAFRYHHDLVGAFRELQDRGVLDIITCGATHGYFPLLGTDANIRAQIGMAVATHEKHFGRKPRGIWLPECAYRPGGTWKAPVASSLGQEPQMRKGIEELLAEFGIEYFIVDSSLVQGGKITPIYMGRFENLRKLMQKMGSEKPVIPPGDEPQSVYEAYHVRSAQTGETHPVSIFARDVETSMQVWSSELGYPGGEWYLDFHKKHQASGHRYWRVTSLDADLGLKTRYRPEKIEAALDVDVAHFVESIKSALAKFHEGSGTAGKLTAPFDSELFGHWWFEGPVFLKKLFQQLSLEAIDITHCAEVLDMEQPARSISLPEGSWGAGGNHYVWFNHEVDWMWPLIYNDEAAMRQAVKTWDGNPDPEWTSILKQMARELWLVESSDWPFLISTLSAIDYSSERFIKHHQAFERLHEMAAKKARNESPDDLERDDLANLRRNDALFDENLINLRLFL